MSWGIIFVPLEEYIPPKLGYTVYRTVLQYYSGEQDEDAYDMRKALTMDKHKWSVVPVDNSSL